LAGKPFCVRKRAPALKPLASSRKRTVHPVLKVGAFRGTSSVPVSKVSSLTNATVAPSSQLVPAM
jgi:hypothetical protein